MTSEEAYWAGLGPEDFRDEEPMKSPLTKEQRDQLLEDLGDFAEIAGVKRLAYSHTLIDELLDRATAKLATATICPNCGGDSEDPNLVCMNLNCVKGVEISDERARELLSELDRLRHVEQLYAASESLRKQLNDAAVKDGIKFNDLLERLKRAEDSDLLVAADTADWEQVRLNGGPPCFHLENGRFCLRARRWHEPTESADHKFTELGEAIRAARAKESK